MFASLATADIIDRPGLTLAVSSAHHLKWAYSFFEPEIFAYESGPPVGKPSPPKI
jgi:hypothetical protein